MPHANSTEFLHCAFRAAFFSSLLLPFVVMRNPHWVGILFRVLAAGVGGYGLTYAATAALTVLVPLPKPDAVLVPTMLSFVLYVAAVVWAFAARSALGAWIGLLAITLPCAGAALLPAVMR